MKEQYIASETSMDSKPQPSRRGFVLGAAVAGAAAAAITQLPTVAHEPSQAEPEAPPAPEKGGGYRLSEHVKRYYKTTRL